MKNLGKYLIAIFIVAVLAGLGGLLYSLLKTQTADKGTESIAELAEQAETVSREETVIVGIDPGFPPFTFKDSRSRLVGFDIDLVKAALAEKTGKTIVFKDLVWSEKTNDLNSGKIDLIWAGLNVNEERKNIYTLSNPYYKNRQLIVVEKNSYISSAEDLGGTIIGVTKGTPSYSAVKKFVNSSGEGFQEIKDTYVDTSDVLTAMLGGEVDAVAGDESLLRYFMNSTPDTFRIVEGVELGNTEAAVAAKKGNIELIGQVNEALSSLQSSGKFEKIYSKWFGQ